MTLSRNLDEWASAYIEAQEEWPEVDEHHELWWAIEWSMGLVTETTEPGDLWHGILQVLAKQPSDKVIGALAAGPLEDLIQYHGPEFIERIEAEAMRNDAFRSLLGGVWESSQPQIWQRVERVRGTPW